VATISYGKMGLGHTGLNKINTFSASLHKAANIFICIIVLQEELNMQFFPNIVEQKFLLTKRIPKKLI
jgi:hypothetical protein